MLKTMVVLEGLQHQDTWRGKTRDPFKGISKDVKKKVRKRLQQTNKKERHCQRNTIVTEG